jgi:hypothetical protein
MENDDSRIDRMGRGNGRSGGLGTQKGTGESVSGVLRKKKRKTRPDLGQDKLQYPSKPGSGSISKGR